ncbi:unnamed protein product [Paramecium pentaurelia]|uniref:Uncharacterized protein n=1 Tax=Paramecium pentaurelia TaxID=43138 RepID=A0A8S1YJR0_9CILI|nr:unnamed protein product [Paramecium pentaurelia]
MNSQNQSYLESKKWKQYLKEYEVDKLDKTQQKLIKTKIQIIITQDNQIIYLQDGAVLRNEILYDISENLEILKNLELIKNLKWLGEYGNNKRKIGKWQAFWQGQLLNQVGGYYEDGQKSGFWKELIDNYWIQAQVYSIGQYINGKKIGAWKYVYHNKNIGGGSYNEEILKNGKWIELRDGFCSLSQIVYNGDYKHGKKVGRWQTLYRDYRKDKFELIGGGLYDERVEDLIKIGRWIELSDGYNFWSEITYNGDYQNAKKVGRWDTFYKFGDKGFTQIGGGLYNDQVEGSSIKIGKWIELSCAFKFDSQVIYKGEYKNGNKIGRWDILFRGQNNEEFKQMQNIYVQYYVQICSGGGSYHDQVEGCSIKIGKWIELNDEFIWNWQINFNGEYQNNKKVGRWDIWYKDYETKMYEQIGGGSYDDDEDSSKIGEWIELSDESNWYWQITFRGEYKNNKKVGRWDTCFKDYETKKNEKIGGGSYNDEGIQIGQWIELSDRSNAKFLITFNGEYIDGKKAGRWDIYWKKNSEDKQNEQIGGGIYYEKMEGYSIKIGIWTELSDESNYNCQLTSNGKYENGKKVGIWREMYRKWNDKEFQKLKEINFDK